MFRGSRGGVRIKRPIARHLYDRFVHKYFAHDVNFELQLLARREAADPHMSVTALLSGNGRGVHHSLAVGMHVINKR